MERNVEPRCKVRVRHITLERVGRGRGGAKLIVVGAPEVETDRMIVFDGDDVRVTTSIKVYSSKPGTSSTQRTFRRLYARGHHGDARGGVCIGAGHGGDDGEGDQTNESGDSPRCVTLNKDDDDDVKMIQSDRLGASIAQRSQIERWPGRRVRVKIDAARADTHLLTRVLCRCARLWSRKQGNVERRFVLFGDPASSWLQ